VSLTRKQIMTSARFAGGVRRYHTWPVLVQQTNADHTYHCIRLYLQIFGPLPPDVTTFLVWHDSGELKTGDLPFPVKAQNPVLKAETDRLEGEAKTAMGAQFEGVLSYYEMRRLKIVDLLEMLEYGLVEFGLGNSYAIPVVRDTFDGLMVLRGELSVADRQKLDEYLRDRVFPMGFEEATCS